MEEVVRKDIISVLNDAETFVKQEDGFKLRELSNHTIHNASIFQDEESIVIAVLIYSLSKIIERHHDGVLAEKISVKIAAAKNNLILNRLQEYKDIVKELLNFISETDSKIKLYIEEVISQARIKKGSKIYEHGISSARAAEILGISQWQLMNYIGNTAATDVYTAGRVKQRLSFARELFK